jgi:hypothetical protein
MKNYLHWHSSKLVALAGWLAAAMTLPIHAQPLVNTTVNTAGGLTTGLGAGSSFGGAASAGPGSIGTAAGATGGLGGSLPADAHASGAFETIGMRQQRLAARSELAAAPSAMAALRAGPSVQDIRAASSGSRLQMTSTMDDRVAASAKAMAAMQVQSKSLPRDAQAEFKAAARDVAIREKDLKATMKIARRASVETWSESRASLAAKYDAYAQAVAHAEAIAASGPGTTNVAARGTVKP